MGLFNFSDYPKDFNKKMIGKMKDEVRENIINEFVG